MIGLVRKLASFSKLLVVTTANHLPWEGCCLTAAQAMALKGLVSKLIDTLLSSIELHCFFILQLIRILENTADTESCEVQVPYTGQLCRRELQYMQDPSFTNLSASSVLNISVTNQEAVEQFSAALFDIALPVLNPSSECEAAFQLFGCLFYFRACDSNMSALATGALCKDVRDRVCVREWGQLDGLLGLGSLPICEELSDENDGKTCSKVISSREGITPTFILMLPTYF